MIGNGIPICFEVVANAAPVMLFVYALADAFSAAASCISSKICWMSRSVSVFWTGEEPMPFRPTSRSRWMYLRF